jgi:hypothetical protein
MEPVTVIVLCLICTALGWSICYKIESSIVKSQKELIQAEAKVIESYIKTETLYEKRYNEHRELIASLERTIELYKEKQTIMESIISPEGGKITEEKS